MNECLDYASFVALVDDDEHSTHLLTRTLVDQGAHGVQAYGDADAALGRLKAVLGDRSAAQPEMIIIDLKAHSGANLEFLCAIKELIRHNHVPAVVMVQVPEEQGRRILLENGASAVFVRHRERDAYRRVAADIIEFWAQTQRPEAVGM
ncbi:MAG: hypothetical protein ACOH2N_03695 [Devosia sp.]